MSEAGIRPGVNSTEGHDIPRSHRALLAAVAVATSALAAPGIAAAGPVTPYGNGVYQLYPNSYYAFSARTGPDARAGSNLALENGLYNVVRDYSAAGRCRGCGPQDVIVNQAYLDSPETTDLDGRRGFAMTWKAGETGNATDLTYRRTTVVEGTTQADSILKTTLAVTNDSTVTHRIGVQTAVDDQVDQDFSPSFTPWRGELTLSSRHDEPPAFKQFDLINDSANPLRGATRQPFAATVRSTWSTVRPDLGATTPDVFDQRGSQGQPEQNFALPADPETDLSDGQSRSVWIWGPTDAQARSLAPGETASFTIATVAEAPADQPVNGEAPAINGTPAVGTALTSTIGTWTVTTPFTQYERQWSRCDASGESCVAIPGATDAGYTPTSEDAGHVLRLAVTADRGGTATSTVSVPKPAAPAGEAPTATPSPAPTATASPQATATAPLKPATAAKDGKATILFPSSSARLTRKAKTALKALATGRSAAIRVTCVGYTASANGTSGYRTSLGRRRATAVCAFLAERIPGAALSKRTKAGADPVSSNATRKGRARNRRVVVTVTMA